MRRINVTKSYLPPIDEYIEKIKPIWDSHYLTNFGPLHNELEDKLRKQKDSLDEEKRQLSLDRIQYEADKNELANNMLKFNEIVGTFTDGVGNLN